MNRDVRFGHLHVRRQRQVVPARQHAAAPPGCHPAGRTIARRNARRAGASAWPSIAVRSTPAESRDVRLESAGAADAIAASEHGILLGDARAADRRRHGGAAPESGQRALQHQPRARAPTDAHDRHERRPDAVEAGEQSGAHLQVDATRRIRGSRARTLRDGLRRLPRDGWRALASFATRSISTRLDRSTSMARIASRSAAFSAFGSSATRETSDRRGCRSKTQTSTAAGAASADDVDDRVRFPFGRHPFHPGARLRRAFARWRAARRSRPRARATAPPPGDATAFRSPRATRRAGRTMTTFAASARAAQSDRSISGSKHARRAVHEDQPTERAGGRAPSPRSFPSENEADTRPRWAVPVPDRPPRW